jgi:hypothetical protein
MNKNNFSTIKPNNQVEIEKLKKETINVHDECIKTTERIAKMIEDTQHLGIETMNVLDKQTEQTACIIDELDELEHKQKTSNILIKKMENFFTGWLYKTPIVSATKQKTEVHLNLNKPNINFVPVTCITEKKSITDIQNDSFDKIINEKDRIEDINLDMIGRGLDNLLVMGNHINNEISIQNKNLDIIANGVDKNQDIMTTNTKRIKKIY